MKYSYGIKTNIPLLILIFVVLFAFCFAFGNLRIGQEENPIDTVPVWVDTQDTDTAQTDVTDDEKVTSDVEVTLPPEPVTDADTTQLINDTVSPQPVPPVDATPTVLPGSVTYANQVPKSDAVGDDYFNDALFLGDSRTFGIQTSTALDATFYSKISFNISQRNKTDEKSRFITVNDNGTAVKCNIYEALEYKSDFGKIYICCGVSELGWEGDAFFDEYRDFISYLKMKMPDAKIYIQTLVPVTAEYSLLEKFGVTNERIWYYNERIASIAADYGLYLVNTAECFLTEQNTLPPEFSPDGLHLYGERYREWLDYLKNHTVE